MNEEWLHREYAERDLAVLDESITVWEVGAACALRQHPEPSPIPNLVAGVMSARAERGLNPASDYG